MKKWFLAIILSGGFLTFPLKGTGQTRLDITDWGASGGDHSNVLPAVRKILEYCRGKKDVTVSFPKGRYDFWPMSAGSENQAIGFDIRNMENLTIEGNGSEFVFHGRMQIANVDSSAGIVFRDFSVDWDRPYISQAEIVRSEENYLDVRIDRRQYPYVIENSKILFTGEGWKLPVISVYNNLFDKVKKEIVYKTWDHPLGTIFEQRAEEIGSGIVRFHGEVPFRPDPGTLVSLFHERYAVEGFKLLNSKDILLKNLKIYHALSHGILGIRTENISLDNASMTVNDSKGRVFSILADASHFINCKGVIKIENCAHTGQGDDFVNVRGTNAKITRILNPTTVEVVDSRGYTVAGDEVWFVDQVTTLRREVRTVKSMTPVYENGRPVAHRLEFIGELPPSLKENDFIENKSWSASLELRNCRILKRHRARGILVTTPRRAVIEDNYFRSAGTAILVEGDLDYWHESGAHEDLLIRNNIFDDCLTSGNFSGSRAEWGEAVITITPSHKPRSEHEEPYHKNIRIQNNVFRVFDAPIVRARSVRKLDFSGNQVVKTFTYKPYTWQKSAFLLDGCREVTIRGNQIDPAYTTRDILIEHMKKSDVTFDRSQGFTLDFLVGINTYHSW